MRQGIGPVVAAAAMAAAGGVSGAAYGTDTYGFSIATKRSSLNVSTEAVAPFTGHLIGNYDAKTNPGGTQTRPGWSGGSGNMPVPLDGEATASGDVDSSPAGNFVMVVDAEALDVSVSALGLDLLNGTEATIGLSVEASFDRFRTFNPSSFYPGATIPVPLGDAAVTTLTLAQTGGGVGELTPTGTEGEYDFVVAVETLLTVGLRIGEGEPQELDPIPQVTVLAGRLVLAGDTATITSVVPFDVDFVGEEEIPGLQDFAVDLPTVLPPGETAHLLVSFNFTGQTVGILGEMSLAGDGVKQEPSCPADCDGNGFVTSADVGCFLTLYFSDLTNGTLASDCDGNGVITSADVGCFLTVYFAGIGPCP